MIPLWVRCLAAIGASSLAGVAYTSLLRAAQVNLETLPGWLALVIVWLAGVAAWEGTAQR